MLTDKVAVITGGGTGIGRACALRLATEGAHVVINYSRSKDDAEATQKDVEALGREAVYAVFDTNVVGALLCCKEAARRMSTSQGGAGGAIVNISSGAAMIGGNITYRPLAKIRSEK